MIIERVHLKGETEAVREEGWQEEKEKIISVVAYTGLITIRRRNV